MLGRASYSARGISWTKETVRIWFGLRKQEVTFVNYDRVVVFFRFKERAHFSRKRLRRLPFEPGSVVIKLFLSLPFMREGLGG